MSAFGSLALVDEEFQLTTEERLVHSLEHPESRHALTTTRVNKVTKARIQYALSELAHNNSANVQRWLEQVAAESPKAAIELYIELLQFTLPKIKAVAVDMHHTSDANPKNLSLQELQQLVNGDRVVSSQ